MKDVGGIFYINVIVVVDVQLFRRCKMTAVGLSVVMCLCVAVVVSVVDIRCDACGSNVRWFPTTVLEPRQPIFVHPNTIRIPVVEVEFP